MQEQELYQQLSHAQQLVQLGANKEARAIYRRLHQAQPQQLDVLLQFALLERAEKRWDAAIQLLTRAVTLAPAIPVLREHLCNVLLYSNSAANHRAAVTHYAALLMHMPEQSALALNLMTLALRNDMLQAVLTSIAPLLVLPSLESALQLHYGAACAIASYLTGDHAACEQYLATALAARDTAFDADGKPLAHDRYFMLMYAEFIRDLLGFRAAQPELYTAPATAPLFHVIGESHSLTPAHLALAYDGQVHRVASHLIMGAKAYFLSLEADNAWKETLSHLLHTIPRDAPVMLCFGEIDCRPTEGIMAQYRRDPAYPIASALATLCEGYMGMVARAARKRKAPTYILGVPAPQRSAAVDLTDAEVPVFLKMIQQFNAALAAAATQNALRFLDIYARTADSDGWAKEGVHLDHVHLKPSIIAALMAAITPTETLRH